MALAFQDDVFPLLAIIRHTTSYDVVMSGHHFGSHYFLRGSAKTRIDEVLFQNDTRE